MKYFKFQLYIFLMLMMTFNVMAAVRNGSLSRCNAKVMSRYIKIDKLRENGWKCPDLENWPSWWFPVGKNVHFQHYKRGGAAGDAYAEISGNKGFLYVYDGTKLKKTDYILSFWAKGKGILRVGYMAYGKKSGKIIGVTPPKASLIKVDSEEWIYFRTLMKTSSDLHNVHIFFQAFKGKVAFDNIEFKPATPLMEKMVEQAGYLYSRNGLISNVRVTDNSEQIKKVFSEYQQLIQEIKITKDKIPSTLYDEIMRKDEAIRLRVNLEKKIVRTRYVNDMIMLIGVCRHLLKQPAPLIHINVKKTGPSKDNSSEFLAPGKRNIKTGEVKVSKIWLNKLRYDENENASAIINIKNSSSKTFTGKIIVSLCYGLNQSKIISNNSISIAPGKIQERRLDFKVGPETYGRGLKVTLYNETGKSADSWQEYFPVAKEWLRVQQSLYAGGEPRLAYFNQSHRFALEPTDFGVNDTSTTTYLSGQVRYKVITRHKKDRYKYLDKMGIKGTIYQTSSFCGQMGYEEARKHPEFLMYDTNGQFAVDPVYGGYPNPMELDSPVDIGKTRKIKHKFLNRKLTSWQHVNVNLANQEAIKYGAEKVKEFSKKMAFNGVYFDGNLGVQKGYDYTGKLTVPSDKIEDYVKLNARNHKLWAKILKSEDPYFGLWYNWSLGAMNYYVKQRGMKNYLGSGIIAGDEALKAAASGKNITFLSEWQTHMFLSGMASHPQKCLEMLLKNRDFITQRYGANTIVGYIFIPIKDPKKGGLNKWAWTTVNYLSAQIIAAQTRLAGGFYPSFRPMTQFMARYCRFIWSPKLKVVKNPEKIIKIHCSKKIWWKNTVYKIKGNKYDYLVINLVAKPNMKKWDFDWLGVPKQIKNTKISLCDNFAQDSEIMALRPYDFDEPQQIVEKQLKPQTHNSSINFTVPSFRYYMMIVCKVKKA